MYFYYISQYLLDFECCTFTMFGIIFMYVSVLYWFFTISVLCKSFTNVMSTKDNSFWVNPCGYTLITNEEFEDKDENIIDRILTLAKVSQNNIDVFKYNYIENIFYCDYLTHYKKWVSESNSWMTPRLLNYAEDNLEKSWLASRMFPNELKFTYEILQRVAVGFEMLLDDAKMYDSSENHFLNNFNTCKNDLQQLLCEISDSIDDKLEKRPIDAVRSVIPNEVRQEKNTARRNLTNSIIFRDYVIAIKYILDTYGHFEKSYKYFKNNINVLV